MPIFDHDDDTVLTKPKTVTKPKLEEPRMYSVLFQNDDYTPMEFVVLCMCKFFDLELDTATRLTLRAHEEGCIRVGRFTLDIAETKCQQITKFARDNQHPLVVLPVEAD